MFCLLRFVVYSKRGISPTRNLTPKLYDLGTNLVDMLRACLCVKAVPATAAFLLPRRRSLLGCCAARCRPCSENPALWQPHRLLVGYLESLEPSQPGLWKMGYNGMTLPLYNSSCHASNMHSHKKLISYCWLHFTPTKRHIWP